MSNLPKVTPVDSSTDTKRFYNQYFTDFINFPTNQVDAVIGFFTSRGFEKTSAIAVGTVMLQQAKLDSINVFELIDTLKGLTNVQLSDIVANVLNYDREKISTLGFKVESKYEKLEQRNILY